MMDEKNLCMCLDESGNRCSHNGMKCDGDLENRPTWCWLSAFGESKVTLNWDK